MMWSRYFAVVLLGLVSAHPGFSQEGRGTILGRVTDPQDSVVANAAIQIVNTATGLTSSVQSNDQGNFSAPYLPLGKYRITAEAKGFKKVVRDNVEVRVNDRLEINLVLEVGALTETVTVTSEAPLLETSSASTGQVIDMRQVADLPIAHGEPYALMASTTGAAFTGDPALDRPFEPSHIANYAIGGARGLRNELTLDGAPSGASTAGAREVSASFVPPVDIVAEMKVQTTALDASVGQTEGGSISLVLKSGTNQFHGTAYYNKLAPELNANLFFANRQGQAIAPLEYNRWGTSATGPVVLPKLYDGHNKTFYMYGYEGIKETRTRGSVNSVPTAAQREGDLSGLLRLGANYQIYDPFTRVTAPNGRFSVSPIPGNIIPKARISPIATNILKYYAMPNTTGTVDGGNNLSLPNLPEIADYYSHSWRLDHNISDSWRMFGRVNWYNRASTYSDHFDNVSTGEWFKFHSVAGGMDHVYTVSPTMVVNLRYGFNRFIRDVNRNPAGLGFDLTSLGFPKSWNDNIPADIRRFPFINIAGYYGTNGTVLWRPQDTHEYALAVDKIHGSHSFKIGAQYRIYTKNQINPDISSTGQLVFNETYTKGPLDNAANAPRGQGLAALLLGVLSNGGGIERRATFADRNNMWAVHFQDDWKVTRKLTVNLGLRYEVESPLEDRWNRSVRGFDSDAQLDITQAAQAAYARSPIPELPASQFRARGGVNFAGVNQPTGVWNRDANNIMPRIGLAYSLNNKTVIRAGYGLFYTFMGVRRGDVIQSGFSFTTQVNATQDNGLNFLADIRNPFPNGVIEPPGSSLGANTFVGQSVSFFEPNVKTPYGQRWNFSIQRELPNRMVFEADYIGDRGVSLETTRDLNALPLQYLSRTASRDNVTNSFLAANVANPFAGLVPTAPGRNGVNVSRQSLLVRYPQFTGVSVNTNQGYSTYHSVAARIEKRFAKGYQFQFGYTFSKFMEATGYLNGADAMPVYTISDQDYPHRFNLSFIYELPVGKGRAVLGNAGRLANGILGGWQVQGIYVWQSGQPLGFGNAIYYGGNLRDVVLPSEQRTIDKWFDTSRFEKVSTAQLVSNVRVLAPRYAFFRGPNPSNWDLSAIKNTQITEKVRFQIRGEFLNAFNHPFFANPNTDPVNTAFGTITSTRGYARRIQLGAKLIY